MDVKTDLSAYRNDEYKQKLPNILVRVGWLFVSSIIFRNSLVTSYPLKRYLLRLFGAKIGIGLVIKPSVNIKYPWNLTIGDHSWIGEEVWIDNLGKVIIGSHVCISQGAMLLTGNHDYSSRLFPLMVQSITLGDGCWIGAKALVSPGVTCGEHSVLAVMSVASRNLEPYTIYRGNPAEPVKIRVIQ